MMTLQDAIVLLANANLTETNDWYPWQVNPEFLPAGIVLPVGNPYTQNVALKLKLCSVYSSTM